MLVALGDPATAPPPAEKATAPRGSGPAPTPSAIPAKDAFLLSLKWSGQASWHDQTLRELAVLIEGWARKAL